MFSFWKLLLIFSRPVHLTNYRLVIEIVPSLRLELQIGRYRGTASDFGLRTPTGRPSSFTVVCRTDVNSEQIVRARLSLSLKLQLLSRDEFHQIHITQVSHANEVRSSALDAGNSQLKSTNDSGSGRSYMHLTRVGQRRAAFPNQIF